MPNTKLLLFNNFTSQTLTVKNGYNFFDSTQLGFMEVKKGWIPIISVEENIRAYIACTNTEAPFLDYRCFLRSCAIFTNNKLKHGIKINLFNSTIYYSEFSKHVNKFGVYSIQIKTFNYQTFTKYIAINAVSNLTLYKSVLSNIILFLTI